jgi:hypothetical protein
MRIGPPAEPSLSLASSHPEPSRAPGSAEVEAGRGTGLPDSTPSFVSLLEGLGREVQRGESLVRSAVGAARAGAAVGPAELIALQAGVYRYGEAVDLASRLVDRATTAVKTVLQGQ